MNPHAVLDTVGVIGTNSLRYSAAFDLIGFTVACIAVSWVSFIGLAMIGKTIRTIDKEGKIVVLINKISADHLGSSDLSRISIVLVDPIVIAYQEKVVEVILRNRKIIVEDY